MYKHNADSIKETQEKQFVSIEDKNRWNNKASGNHNHDEIYNSKSEIDNILDTAFINIQDKQITVDSYCGFTKNTEILGRTVQYTENLTIIPTMESGGFNTGTGENSDITSPEGEILERYRSQEYIPIQINDKITFTPNMKMNVLFFDKNKKFISNSYVCTDSAVVNNVNAAYMRFYSGPGSENSEVHIERTHLSDFRSVGEFKDDNIYDLDIIRSGKNLLNIPQTYSREMIFGGVRNAHRVVYCKLNNNTDYTISGHHIKSNNERYNGGFHIVLHSEIPNETDYWFLEQPVTSLYRSELPETDVNVTFNSRKHNYLAIYVGIATGDKYNHTSILENFQLEVGTEKTEYEPYTEERIHLSLPVQLEGIVDDIHDRIFVREDGVVCIEKKIKEKSYINTTPFIFEDSPALTNTYMYGISSTCLDNSSNILCDNIPTMEAVWNIDKEGMYINGSGNHYILRLSKSRFTNEPTLNEVKDLLNTFNFKYVSPEPEIIELYNINDLSISLKNGINTIQTSSSIHHDIKCSIPMSISTSVESQVDKIQQIKENVSNISNVIGVNNNLAIEIKNGYKTVKSDVEGITSDVLIEGDTYVSALDTNFYKFNRSDFYDLTTLAKIDSEGFITVNKSEEDISFKNIYPRRKLYNVKPNTEYTYIIEIVENTMVRPIDDPNAHVITFGNTAYEDVSHHKTVFTLNSRASISGGKIGIYKYLFKTRSDTETMNLNHIGDRIFIYDNATGKIKFRYCLIEGNHLDNPSINNSFKGLCSVSENNELVLESNNKNLFKYTPYNRGNGHYEILDNGVRIHSNGASITYTFKYFSVDVKPNTTYKISWDEPEVILGKSNVGIYLVCNSELVKTYKNDISTTECIITTDNITGTGNFKLALSLYATASDVKSVGDVIYRNISIVEVEDDGVFVANETHTRSLNLSEPLRGLPNGVKDTIEKINGKWCVVRRCGEYVMTNKDRWVKVVDAYQPEDRTLITFNNDTTYKLLKDDIHLLDKPSMLCDNFRVIGGNTTMTRDTIKYHYTDKRLRICLLRSSLTTEDVEGLKAFLQGRRITVVYELPKPIIEPLDIDLNLRVYENKTHFITKSGAINPEVKITLPCNLSNTIKTMVDKVQVMENKRHNMIQFLLNSTYEADKTSYRFEILTNNVRNVSLPEDYDLYTMYKYIIEKRGYDRYDLEDRIDFYTVISKFSLEMADELFTIIEEQN